jgi:hypothetical protein
MTEKDDLMYLIEEAEELFPSQVEAIADHLIANGVTVQRWIPVTERLPESLDFVVALTTGGDRIIAKRDKYGWLRYGGYECERLRPITHWMPLPEPPKEVE